MPARSGPVIASRTLAHAASGRAVLLELAKPRRVAAGEYRCDFRLRGAGPARHRRAFGVDGLQALLLAGEAARLALAPDARAFAWGDGPAGELGLSRVVPELFGRAATGRIYRGIDRLLAAEARAATRAARARRTRGKVPA